MTHHWHSAVDKCQSVRCVFVDFVKAFDHIDHNILVDRMRSLGLLDFIVRWMCAFLQGRHQRVKIGDVLSDWLPVIAGMPQGSYLGPLTFIMLINGLEVEMGIEPNSNRTNRTRTGQLATDVELEQNRTRRHKEPEPNKNPAVWVLKSSRNWLNATYLHN